MKFTFETCETKWIFRGRRRTRVITSQNITYLNVYVYYNKFQVWERITLLCSRRHLAVNGCAEKLHVENENYHQIRETFKQYYCTYILCCAPYVIQWHAKREVRDGWNRYTRNGSHQTLELPPVIFLFSLKVARIACRYKNIKTRICLLFYPFHSLYKNRWWIKLIDFVNLLPYLVNIHKKCVMVK